MHRAERRRVVVTGIGVCSPLGLDRESTWRACLAGTRAIAPIPRSWERFARYRSRWWAPLPPLDAAMEGISPAEAMRLDPVQLLALRASREALAQAVLSVEPTERKDSNRLRGVDPERAGVFLGTGTGGIASMLTGHLSHRYEQRKEPLRALPHDAVFASSAAEGILADLVDDIRAVPRFNPFVVAMEMSNAIAALLAIRYSLAGACDTVSLACASGTAAIGRAWRAIAGGEIDLALAGGSECLRDTSGSIFRSFDIARTLTACEDPLAAGGGPYDAARSGFLFSEGGSGVLVLEEREAALARGAQPVAEILGYAETNDAFHLLAPEPSGRRVDALIERVLRTAGRNANDIDYVNGHGTGTMANDAIETAAIARCLGTHPAVNSTKSLIGHTIGASGAIEAAICCLSLAEGRLHPSANLSQPIADLNFVREARTARLRHALSLSFAFGGHNTALVFAAVD